MKLLPDTLIGRTALLIALLIALSNLAAFGIVRVLYAGTLRDAFAGEIAENIYLAQTELHAMPPAQRAAFLAHVSVNGTRLVAEDMKSAKAVPTHDNRPLEERLQATLGQQIMVETDPTTHDMWVGFKSDGQGYWYVLPRSRIMSLLPYGPLAWIVLLVVASVGGAYLVIFGLSRRLRAVIAAARTLGRGEKPDSLEESGPREIRELGRGFNQMAEGLQRVDAERRLMLAGISHDLRSPLARVRLGLEMITDGDRPELAGALVQDVEEIDAIIAQFLDYARDGLEEEPGEGDLNQIVLDICGRYTAAGAEIGTDLEAIPSFSFRRLALRRMVANLVDNAVRYGGNRLQVITRRLSGKVLITVLDRGPGIGDADPESLLKPFVRANSSRGDQYGAGLGLAIAERIARAHAGMLRLSNREGGGLQVVVEIPLA